MHIYTHFFAVVDGWPHIFLVALENITSDQEITADCDDEYQECRACAENIHARYCAQEARPDHCIKSESQGTNSDYSQNDATDEEFCGADEDESESECEDLDEKRALDESESECEDLDEKRALDESESECEDLDENRALEERMYSENEVIYML